MDEEVRATRTLIREAIDAEMADGKTLQEAAAAALDALIARRKAAAVLKAIGPMALAYIWRMEQRDARQAYRFDFDDEPAPPPAPRVDTAPLARPEAMLNSLHHIDGKWLPLRVLGRAECRRAWQGYEAREKGNAARKRAFLFFEEALHAGKRIGDQFTEDEVRRVFRDAESARPAQADAAA